MKLLPSLTYLIIIPSQTLSFVPHDAQFHVTALTELAKRSTNNHTKKQANRASVFMCYTRYNEHQDSALPQFMLQNAIFTALNIQNPPSVIRGQYRKKEELK